MRYYAFPILNKISGIDNNTPRLQLQGQYWICTNFPLHFVSKAL
jgi:hypothetical protein